MNSFLKIKNNKKSASQELETCNRLINLAFSELTNYAKGSLLEHAKYVTVMELLNAKICNKVKKRVVKTPQNASTRLLYLGFFADPSKRKQITRGLTCE